MSGHRLVLACIPAHGNAEIAAHENAGHDGSGKLTGLEIAGLKIIGKCEQVGKCKRALYGTLNADGCNNQETNCNENNLDMFRA